MHLSTLLLVDDSVTIQRVIELSFTDENIRVVSVGDGRRALQWMEREVPDIVLIDIGAPEVDGYEVTSHVRHSPRLKHIPVLLLAGVFEPVDDGQAREAGADGVLVKPFEPEQLVIRVRSLLEHGASRFADIASTGAPPRARVVTPFPGAARLSVAASPAMAGQSPEPAAVQTRGRPDATLPSRVSLANAFSALLAAEQSTQPAAASPGVLSDSAVEEAIRRALVRMTDGVVRRIVVETAERLIREEIQKIKAQSE
jgi:DNA-binding response OmpR family regulator